MPQARMRSAQDLGPIVSRLSTAKLPLTVSWVEGEKRTAQMNRLIHRWFADVARQVPGETAAEVKAQANLAYGVPILRRDDNEWGSAFGYLFDSLNYGSKIKAMRVLDVPVTRRMKVKQLLEYMEQFERDYRAQGVRLTDPEGLKYEGK